MIADLVAGEGARPPPPRSVAPTSRSASQVDVSDEDAVQAMVDAAVLAFGGARPGRQQRRAVAVEAAARDHRGRLGPPARRDGQGLVPGLAGRGAGADRPGAGRRHRLHLLEELDLRRARTTSPTPRPRPTRPTRCGCSRPSSASTASRSTAINPDGVVRGSGIFAGGWGANRAAVYGVRGEGPRQVLRAAHASSSARCCRSTSPTRSSSSCGPDLTHTTGLHVPVDAGVAAAFLR